MKPYIKNSKFVFILYKQKQDLNCQQKGRVMKQVNKEKWEYNIRSD